MSDYYKAKIGLFLGSFNPFHVGHLELVKESFNRGMSEVWIVPAMSNPWKNEKPIGIEHRFWISSKMVSGLDRAKVLIVMTDPEEDGKYYSVDQLKKILRSYSARNFEFWIIGGWDTTKDIESWKDSSWILGNFKVLEISRPGYNGCTAEESGRTEISSTEIRSLIKAGDWKSLEKYMNSEAIEYIKNNELYKD